MLVVVHIKLAIITILSLSIPGNFVVDIMHNVSKADVVLLNSGTLRSDAVHPPGVFKKKVIYIFNGIQSISLY